MNTNETFVKVVEIISNNDEAVVKQAKECVTDIEGYFNAHAKAYDERGIEEIENENDTKWLGIVDILIEHSFACEVDYSVEVEDFLFALNETKRMADVEIVLDEDELDEEGEVTEWCHVIDQKLADQHYCLASMDIDSDSYVIFMIKTSEFDELVEITEAVGYRIDVTTNM